MKITAEVARGKNKGTILVPHKTREGNYIVSETRFAEDQIHVGTLDEVVEHVRKGYKLRMSPEAGGAASLMSPSSITISD